MEIYKILLYLGMALLMSSLLVALAIQYSAASKHGVYSSLFKKLDSKQIKMVKTSGYLFAAGLLFAGLGALLNYAL